MLKNKVALIVLIVSALTLRADTKDSDFVISADLFKALHGSFGGTLLYKLADYVALTVPVYIGTNWVVKAMASNMSIIADAKYESSLLFGGGGLGARFLINDEGFYDGFFIEPRIEIGYSDFTLSKESTNLIDSKRITLSPMLLLGYSWFFDNGFFVSAQIMGGAGYHLKNNISVEKNLKNRLKNNTWARNTLWADEGPWRYDVGGDISLGYSW